MARKVLILTGAPESHTLNWDDPNLLDEFLNPIANFAGLSSPGASSAADTILGSALDVALWRSIPLKRNALSTGFSQLHDLREGHYGDARFFIPIQTSLKTTFRSTESDESRQEILEQFYDHSLALHDDLSSSQLPTVSFATDGTSLNTNEEESYHVSTQSSSCPTRQSQSFAVESAHLSDLEDIPGAPYLQSIAPQTMTVNLIVGIISITQPRTVKTKWGSTKSLVELLVGDETKCGFSITFWLAEPMDPSSMILRGLRTQDIVLLQNVALGSFMKKVHGHSLRKGLTKVDLLHRRKLDRLDQGGLYSTKDVSSTKAAHPQLLKTRRVREWVMNFVADGGAALGKRKQNGKPIRSWDMPPEDTPTRVT
ncbi:hypothetical protein F4779DRAFT_375495 [Xylariaceae sp. FL0662B]|nr:hypothetical protein F4779DRAFT_375495 [Xylariaceae sp. FL0662B]